jgi:hypothetical protein
MIVAVLKGARYEDVATERGISKQAAHDRVENYLRREEQAYGWARHPLRKFLQPRKDRPHAQRPASHGAREVKVRQGALSDDS